MKSKLVNDDNKSGLSKAWIVYSKELCDPPPAFNPRVQGKKTVLEKMGEVVDVLKRAGSSSDHSQQLAAVLFIIRLLEEKGGQEKNFMRSDSAQTIR